jgi:hypothetical protein
MLCHIPIIPATQKVEVKGPWFETSRGKVSETLSENQTKQKGLGTMAQVVECLPSKCETLNLIPSATEKGRKKERKKKKKTPGKILL